MRVYNFAGILFRVALALVPLLPSTDGKAALVGQDTSTDTPNLDAEGSIKALSSRSAYFQSFPGYSYLFNNQWSESSETTVASIYDCIDQCWHVADCIFLTFDSSSMYCTTYDIPNYASWMGDPDSWLDNTATSAKRQCDTGCTPVSRIGLAKHAKLAYGIAEIPFGAFFNAVKRLAFHSGFEEPSKVEKFRKFISSSFIFNDFEMQKHPVAYKNLMKCTTFLDVLCEVRGRHATDLRDCVYAYLGHPTATALLEAYPSWMRPDYTKDPMLVHLDFARAYLAHTHDLRILSCVDHGDTLAPPEIESDGILVHGLHVDTVKACSPILRSRDFDYEAWMLKEHNGLKTVTDMIRAEAAPSPYDGAQLALSFVLVAGMCDGSGIQEGHNLAQHILNFVNYTEHFKTDYPCVRLSRDETRSGYVSEAMEQIYLSVSEETRESTTIFPKYLGSVIAACDGRRVFITNKGYIGIGPAAMQAKDECYVICGGSVPFLPRPTRYQTNQFIGEGYVHGLMKGEAAAKQTKDGLHLEEIHICCDYRHQQLNLLKYIKLSLVAWNENLKRFFLVSPK